VNVLIVGLARFAVGHAETFAGVSAHGLATTLTATQDAGACVEHETIWLHSTNTANHIVSYLTHGRIHDFRLWGANCTFVLPSLPFSSFPFPYLSSLLPFRYPLPHPSPEVTPHSSCGERD